MRFYLWNNEGLMQKLGMPEYCFDIIQIIKRKKGLYNPQLCLRLARSLEELFYERTSQRT